MSNSQRIYPNSNPDIEQGWQLWDLIADNQKIKEPEEKMAIIDLLCREIKTLTERSRKADETICEKEFTRIQNEISRVVKAYTPDGNGLTVPIDSIEWKHQSEESEVEIAQNTRIEHAITEEINSQLDRVFWSFRRKAEAGFRANCIEDDHGYWLGDDTYGSYVDPEMLLSRLREMPDDPTPKEKYEDEHTVEQVGKKIWATIEPFEIKVEADG